MSKKAIYLAGGGARGAYQAGVLKAIQTILSVKKIPFDMISGVSVGSINAGVLAEYADDFSVAVEKLIAIWSNLHCHTIFNASNFALSKSVMRNVSNLIVRQRQSGFLLDTSPLRRLIEDNLDPNRIKLNLAERNFETLEVMTQCYDTHQTISFYEHHFPSFEDWYYPRHISKRADIGIDHILASSALPLFFPAVHVNGYHYGDGSMGLISPLRGVIRFQVEKVMILGTRQAPQFLAEPEPSETREVGFAHVLGGIMNSLFADNLDRDIELVNRMNDIAKLLSLWKKRRSPWRPIETLYLRPTEDVAVMARDKYMYMPTLLRLMLNVLGAKNQSGELLSFLLFERPFTESLIELGYSDTMKRANDVIKFFAN